MALAQGIDELGDVLEVLGQLFLEPRQPGLVARRARLGQLHRLVVGALQDERDHGDLVLVGLVVLAPGDRLGRALVAAAVAVADQEHVQVAAGDGGEARVVRMHAACDREVVVLGQAGVHAARFQPRLEVAADRAEIPHGGADEDGQARW
jgi:hypothetical protein